MGTKLPFRPCTLTPPWWVICIRVSVFLSLSKVTITWKSGSTGSQTALKPFIMWGTIICTPLHRLQSNNFEYTFVGFFSPILLIPHGNTKMEFCSPGNICAIQVLLHFRSNVGWFIWNSSKTCLGKVGRSRKQIPRKFWKSLKIQGWYLLPLVDNI